MNPLSDLLNRSPLVDRAASLPDGITLQWLAENAEQSWSDMLTARYRLETVPRLSSILAGLSGHPLGSYVTSAYLPVIPTYQWRSDFAVEPNAPQAFDPEDWVEFLSGTSGNYGVIVPEFATSEYELALFFRPSSRMLYSSPNMPLTSVIVGLGRRLRGRRVTMHLSEDGCTMSTAGPCTPDGDCPGSCEKRRHTGRLGEGLRCACDDAGPSSTVTHTAVSVGQGQAKAERAVAGAS
jgi:hypothetical protein